MALKRCSFSICWCPDSWANRWACCTASCDFMVKLLKFIGLFFQFLGSITLPERVKCQNVRKPLKTKDISSVVRFGASNDSSYKFKNLWGYLEGYSGR